MTIKQKAKDKLVDDWRSVFKKWSAQITLLVITAQSVWVGLPNEAKDLLPSPQYIGLGLGIAAFAAMFIKQKESADETEE